MKVGLHCAASVLIATLAGAALSSPVGAQSLPEVLEAIQRARVTTRILYVTAHPDDESSSVLTYLARGLGADVALLSITRGEGGQNALGPEQAPQLGILRTAELEAATRVYGVRLYFTRAPDFGYSKTPEETLKIWNNTALEDMVHVIRSFRPHVIINHWAGVRSGHGQHQAAGLLTPRALAAASVQAKKDPADFWMYDSVPVLNLARGGAANGARIPADEVSPLWGKSYIEMGLEGFANHRTQGIVGFRGSPFFRRPLYLVEAKGEKIELAELARPLTKLSQHIEGDERALPQVDRLLADAREAALRLDWAAATRSLAVAGKKLAELIGYFSKGVEDSVEARLLDELRWVAPRIDSALILAAGIQMDAEADRSEVVTQESFSLRLSVRRRPEVPCEFGKPGLVLPEGWSVPKEELESTGAVRLTVSMPKDARVPRSENDWMLPWPPALVGARVRAVVEGYAFDVKVPVVAQRVSSTRVDTLPVTLVPAATLALEPRQFLVLEKRPPKQLELVARVHYYGTAPAQLTVGLDAPERWQTSPPPEIEFTGTGDQLVRFGVIPPARVSAGSYPLKAYARRGAEVFRTGLEPLPSLPTRLWSEPAVAVVRAFDVAVPENLRVGYVAAENDPIPEALRQLGVQVELLDPAALAFGDLKRFDAIAIGIRAYELRDDLARANQRLLDYAAAGGTLLVQYQREGVWNTLKPAPYPAAIGERPQRAPDQNPTRDANPPPGPPPVTRITDENSAVRFLTPDHPVLNFPNKISAQDFEGWVQERGLYFWTQFDSRYQPVLALRDPDEEEAPGGLVYARTGEGVYIYTGLAFFRQLPEGVAGAYRLFINLLSQSRRARQSQ